MVAIALAVAAALAVLALWALGGWYVRKKGEFVYVDDDGSARELTAEEREYLNTKFQFGDGARPYVKGRYDLSTPDGHLRGYLERSRLPWRVRVQPAPPNPTRSDR